MMEKVIASRSSLRKVKESLVLAKDGYALLEKKREALMKEFFSVVEELRNVYSRLSESLQEYYMHFKKGSIALGVERKELLLAQSTSLIEVETIYRSVMGIRVPNLNITKANIFKPGLAFSTFEMDLALQKAEELQHLLVKYIETRYIVNILAREIKKTQRRVNALDVFFIPMYGELKAWIENVLEENDREMFVRQKMVKQKTKKKAEGV